MPFRPGSDTMLYRLAFVFLLLTLCIGSTGYLYYDFHQRHSKQEIQDELSAIADLKVKQITAWRKERIDDATITGKNSFLAAAVRQFLQNPDAPRLRQELLDWTRFHEETYGYRNILIVDTRGTIRLSADRERLLSDNTKKLIEEAIRTKQTILSDIHKGVAIDYIHLDLIAPIIPDKRDSAVPVGAVVIRVDPELFLYPLIQTWPGPSKTAETLLLRREKNEAVFLNEARHKKGTALNFHVSLSKKPALAAVLDRAEKGIIEVRDYRDVPVLASIQLVPGTSWFLVAKVDIEEIYAPIRERARLLLVIIFMLIAAAGLSIIFWWRKKIAEYARVQQESELDRQSLAQQYDYLSRYANDIVLLIDPDGNIAQANDRAMASYGYARDELLQLNIRDIRHPETRDEVTVQMNQVREHGGFIFETIHQRKNGSTFPVEVSSRVIDIGGKKFFQSIIRDITERKKAEKALIEGEKRYKKLIESVTDYIYTVRVEDGRPVSTTHGPGCMAVTGYTSEEYQADPDLWHRMILDKDRDAVIAQANNILTGGPTLPYEHRIIHKDGAIRWVRNTPVPRYDAEGRLIAYDGLVTDITRLKQLESQLRQAQKMEAVGQLAGGIAHDFNNILTAVIGYSNLLMMKLPAHGPGRAYAEQIISSSERAAHLTRSLLAFSRKQIIDLRPLNLNSIIKRVEKLLARVIGEDIEFKTMLSATALPILADSIQIEQVLMNLATNARDAMPDGGTLLIETAPIELGEEFVRSHSYVKPGMYAYLSVADTGIGMNESIRNRIFEPFFTTKEVGKGTGLGLSMAYGIIKQHNGYIDVASEPGAGTTFKMYFPLTSAVVGEEKPQEQTVVERGTETILLAEDDATVRKLSKNVLEDFGYRVIEAVDGEDAVKKFSENKDTVDIVVLDIIMPKKNGKEVYEEIKKGKPDVKALFTSGYTANTIHKKGILDNGLEFILKPITPTDFLKRVRKVLDKR